MPRRWRPAGLLTVTSMSVCSALVRPGGTDGRRRPRALAPIARTLRRSNCRRRVMAADDRPQAHLRRFVELLRRDVPAARARGLRAPAATSARRSADHQGRPRALCRFDRRAARSAGRAAARPAEPCFAASTGPIRSVSRPGPPHSASPITWPRPPDPIMRRHSTNQNGHRPRREASDRQERSHPNVEGRHPTVGPRDPEQLDTNDPDQRGF